MMRKRTSVVVAAVCVLVLIGLTGCATIVGEGSPEVLHIRSNPDQASVTINDETGMKVYNGTTPTNVALEKKKGFFAGKKYQVTIAKSGFATQQITVDTRVNGWYLGGNLIFGGLIGYLIVDPATGAMWALDNTEINATLQPQTSLNNNDHREVRIVLLQDVPTNLQDKMVKIK